MYDPYHPVTWKSVTLLQKTLTQVFLYEIFKIFKSTYFEEHLRTTAPKCSENKSIACIRKTDVRR